MARDRARGAGSTPALSNLGGPKLGVAVEGCDEKEPGWLCLAGSWPAFAAGVWNRAGMSDSFPYPGIRHLVQPLRPPPGVWEGLRGVCGTGRHPKCGLGECVTKPCRDDDRRTELCPGTQPA